MSIKYKILKSITSLFSFGKTAFKPTTKKIADGGFYKFTLNSLEGKAVNFEQYKGKKVLLVNTASKCGFTPQYDELQEFSEKYTDKAVVLGIPSNDFKEQEPGNASEIQEFCKVRFGVTFPLFEKVAVTGSNQHPIYKWLSDASHNGWNNQAPTWNFCKYLISEEGELLAYYASAVSPLSTKITDKLS